MTVDDLRALLADAPGDARVLVAAGDDDLEVTTVITDTAGVLLLVAAQTGDAR